MIVSENSKPPLHEFVNLMKNVDSMLNHDASLNEHYYLGRNGVALESDVCAAAEECAKGTAFEKSIKLVSGASFPDIVANRFYGIEVKSTKDNNWKSIGSSILESTRIDGVERIFLTFGKLASPVEFLSRSYEDCLCGISVTHYPRYQIDMQLKEGETIFDKLGIPYDTLRQMDDPVRPVADYYKRRLKPGESLWWTGSSVDSDVPMTVRLWSTLTPEEKSYYTTKIYAYFPECILTRGSRKYTNATLWLATQCGIVNSNVRDSFSAGGQVTLKDLEGHDCRMPGVYRHVKEHISELRTLLLNSKTDSLANYWGQPVKTNRILQWIELVVSFEPDILLQSRAKSVLLQLFHDN